MTDETKRIGARIRVSLLNELQQAGYNSPTEAIQKGLELLVRGSSSSIQRETADDHSETFDDSCETVEYKKEFESMHT
jgi:hypothetical protein